MPPDPQPPKVWSSKTEEKQNKQTNKHKNKTNRPVARRGAGVRRTPPNLPKCPLLAIARHIMGKKWGVCKRVKG